MKKLGIIGAMQIEVETLVNAMADPQAHAVAGCTFYEGVLEGTPAVVVQCGVGKVNAAMCAQILCSQFAVTHLVNTGIAGSLCNDLDICDLVVSQDAMYHDFNCTAFGYPLGKVPGMDVVVFPAAPAMIAAAQAAAEAVHPGHVRLGRVATGDQFVCIQEMKDAIIATTGALCTEMEGAAIAQTAYRNGVPFVILRAISDKADNSADMDSPTFEALAARRCAQVVLHLAKEL